MDELPPVFDPNNVDYRIIHPLDHSVGSPRCVMLYPTGSKSIFLHLRMSWSLGKLKRLRTLLRR